jgi:hypothetical protein
MQPRTPQVIGVALEGTIIRIAAGSRGDLYLTEHEWDERAPEQVVDQLRAMFGSKRSIALSVGLGFLEIANPELPPMAPEDTRRVLRRDADRYFPLDGAAAVVGPFENGIAFATASERLQRWVRAFEQWGPVRSIVVAPLAIAVALKSGINIPTDATNNPADNQNIRKLSNTSGTAKRSPNSSTSLQTFLIDAASDEFGLLELTDGKVRDVRRIPTIAGHEIASGVPFLNKCILNRSAQNINSHSSDGAAGVPAAFTAAIGALELMDAPLSHMLLDSTLEQSLNARRARRQLTSYALLVAAVISLVFAGNARRASTLRATQHAVDSLTLLAAPGLESAKQLTQLDEEVRTLNSHSDASRDPLAVVAALSRTLPADAFVERLAWDGNEWRLDGSANQAASVVPHLDSAHRFTDVRVLSASTRFRDGARTRESFSVAFKVKGDSSGGR